MAEAKANRFGAVVSRDAEQATSTLRDRFQRTTTATTPTAEKPRIGVRSPRYLGKRLRVLTRVHPEVKFELQLVSHLTGGRKKMQDICEEALRHAAKERLVELERQMGSQRFAIMRAAFADNWQES